MDVRSEIPREGRYVKVATDVADRVIKELYGKFYTSCKSLQLYTN